MQPAWLTVWVTASGPGTATRTSMMRQASDSERVAVTTGVQVSKSHMIEADIVFATQ